MEEYGSEEKKWRDGNRKNEAVSLYVVWCGVAVWSVEREESGEESESSSS